MPSAEPSPTPAETTAEPSAEVVVSLPRASWAEALGELPGVRAVVWDCAGPVPDPAPQVVVPPYMGAPPLRGSLDRLPALRTVQLLTNGFDGVVEQLPDHVTLCNAAGVHDASTAELAVGLAIAALRGIDDAARSMASGAWTAARRTSLADRRALVLGWGGVGRAVADRLEPFEVQVTAVASAPRVEEGPAGRVRVHGPAELPDLLPEHDLVVVACPLTDATRGLVDAAFLAALPDGALVVNVGRGPVVDTDALLAEVRTGRLRAALDVTDPEPLPPAHPLWSTPGVLVTPHVGGNTTAFRPRALALLREQLQRTVAGAPLLNVVRAGRDAPRG
ncbi:2-hydroxyacid dehydrogenase [Kineococcus terrestris]|uniref:2-hydroxyacid dehydrogenase n=1 Tax=Kineococcus terrestris TaxID=2044856 RepID=UPI0034DB79B4